MTKIRIVRNRILKIATRDTNIDKKVKSNIWSIIGIILLNSVSQTVWAEITLAHKNSE